MAKQQLQAAKKKGVTQATLCRERKNQQQQQKKGARQTESVNKVRHSLSSRNCKVCNTLAR